MLRVLSGESYSSVKLSPAPAATAAAAAASSYQHQQAAITPASADVPLKSVCDSGIDSIQDLDKPGRLTTHAHCTVFAN